MLLSRTARSFGRSVDSFETSLARALRNDWNCVTAVSLSPTALSVPAAHRDRRPCLRNGRPPAGEILRWRHRAELWSWPQVTPRNEQPQVTPVRTQRASDFIGHRSKNGVTAPVAGRYRFPGLRGRRAQRVLASRAPNLSGAQLKFSLARGLEWPLILFRFSSLPVQRGHWQARHRATSIVGWAVWALTLSCSDSSRRLCQHQHRRSDACARVPDHASSSDGAGCVRRRNVCRDRQTTAKSNVPNWNAEQDDTIAGGRLVKAAGLPRWRFLPLLGRFFPVGLNRMSESADPEFTLLLARAFDLAWHAVRDRLSGLAFGRDRAAGGLQSAWSRCRRAGSKKSKRSRHASSCVWSRSRWTAAQNRSAAAASVQKKPGLRSKP